MILIKKYTLTLIFLLSLVIGLNAQNKNFKNKIKINGKVYSTMVVDGDTIILADLDPVSYTSIRKFASEEERKKYRLYKYYAAKAYPYAKDAINILNKIEERTVDMEPKKRKRYIKNTYRQLEHNFKQQLKKLSKTQGKILVKMIEKETNTSFYKIIKRMRNGFVAFYWHRFSKFFGYDLKRGYHVGDDKMMDVILQDFRFDDDNTAVLNAELLKKEEKTKPKK